MNISSRSLPFKGFYNVPQLQEWKDGSMKSDPRYYSSVQGMMNILNEEGISSKYWPKQELLVTAKKDLTKIENALKQLSEEEMEEFLEQVSNGEKPGYDIKYISYYTGWQGLQQPRIKFYNSKK